MSASRLKLMLTMCALLSVAGETRGQFIGPGSSLPGHILRGEGVFLSGAGFYNYYSAVGWSIDVNTWIRLNEYLYNAAKHENLENARHRAEVIARNRENYNKNLERIRANPEALDLEKGDALNAVLEQLLNPKIAPSSFRASTVPVPGDTVRSIPFFFGPEDATFSLQRLTAKGRWPVGFRGEELSRERRAYERAVDAALEQQLDGKLSREAIRAVEIALNNLADRLDKVVPPSRDKVYLEAKNYLRRLTAAKELFKRREIERILAEIDKYAGTTVFDLITFMQRNNLRFGVPDLGDERELYPKLYAFLKSQLDQVSEKGDIRP
jgi:hypothetical protein